MSIPRSTLLTGDGHNGDDVRARPVVQRKRKPVTHYGTPFGNVGMELFFVGQQFKSIFERPTRHVVLAMSTFLFGGSSRPSLK